MKITILISSVSCQWPGSFGSQRPRTVRQRQSLPTSREVQLAQRRLKDGKVILRLLELILHSLSYRVRFSFRCLIFKTIFNALFLRVK